MISTTDRRLPNRGHTSQWVSILRDLCDLLSTGGIPPSYFLSFSKFFMKTFTPWLGSSHCPTNIGGTSSTTILLLVTTGRRLPNMKRLSPPVTFNQSCLSSSGSNRTSYKRVLIAGTRPQGSVSLDRSSSTPGRDSLLSRSQVSREISSALQIFRALYTSSKESGIAVPSEHWFYLTAQVNLPSSLPLRQVRLDVHHRPWSPPPSSLHIYSTAEPKGS